MHGKNEASPYEFDMVINCDFIDNPLSVAEVVAKAYFEKFSTELDKKKVVHMPETDKKN
jgi:hypothetical protein